MHKPPERSLAVIMFMDIVGYSALVGQSEEKAMSFVTIHKEVLEKYAEEYHGEVIQYYGDGSLTMFKSAVEATKCAIHIQNLFLNDHQLPMRIGLHLGEVVRNNETIYGNGVNVAARLESMGVGGSVLISEAINIEIKNQEGLDSKFMGEYSFKNIEEKITIYALSEKGLVIPSPKDLKSDKSKRVSSIMLRNIGATVFLLAAFLIQHFYFNNSGKSNVNVLEERISIPTFKNFTGEKKHEFISEMVAHRLTKELFEVAGSKVVDFRHQGDLNQIKYASITDSRIDFAKKSGAVNIIEGTLQKETKGNLEFSVLMKKLENGEIIKTFPNVVFSADDPISGIKELSEYILGFWEAKDEKLLAFPKLEAYKLYLKAKTNWANDSLSESLLIEAIDIDPSFFDLYDLLLTNYYNTGQADKAERLINHLKNQEQNFTQRQQNTFGFLKSYFNGDNHRGYEHYKKEYEYNKKDMFINTGFMAMCNEFVHKYDETLKVFDQIKIDDLNIKECGYCEDRLELAMNAAIQLRLMNKAEKLASYFPPGLKRMRSNTLLMRYYGIQGQFERLEEMVNTIVQTDKLPNSQLAYYYASREMYVINENEEAEKFARAHLDLHSESTHYSNELAHYFMNDFSTAKDLFYTRVGNLDKTDIWDTGFAGLLEAKTGNREKALDIIQLLNTKEENGFGAIPYYQARIYVHLDEKVKALDLLKSSIRQGAHFYTFNVFENDPAFREIKNDRDFKRIIFPYTSN